MSAQTALAHKTEADIAEEIIVSADSHIMEPDDLWVKNLPASLKDKYPKYPPRKALGEKPGGWDPRARIKEMEVDGVSAEVLYPTLGLRLFALEAAELQEACFEIANAWRATVNTKLYAAANSLFDLVFGGVMERFSRLKFVYVENEIAWMPFHIHEWDKYFIRHSPRAPVPAMKKLPSEYCKQVYATF